MAKKAWVTMAAKDEERAREINTLISSYGIKVEGHFFMEEKQYEKWQLAVPEITDKETGIWIIFGEKKDLLNKELLKSLSLLALCVQAKKGDCFPVLFLSPDEISPDELPFPFKESMFFKPDNPSLGAKITAKAHTPPKKDKRPFYINVLSLEKIGLWLELNPREKGFNGFIFGVEKPSSIKALGIGEKGKIPDKSILEYPIRDMELETGEKKFTAWAAKNRVGEKESIFIKVDKAPDSFLFGEFEDENSPELYIINLC